MSASARGLDVDAERDEAQALALEPDLGAALERRGRRAQHQVGLAADDAERRVEEAPAHAAEVLGMVDEREVVQRHDERRRARRQREPGRVDHVDGPGRATRPRVAAAGASSRTAARGAAAARARGSSAGTPRRGGSRCRAETPISETLGARVQLAREPQRGDGGASRAPGASTARGSWRRARSGCPGSEHARAARSRRRAHVALVACQQERREQRRCRRRSARSSRPP